MADPPRPEVKVDAKASSTVQVDHVDRQTPPPFGTGPVTADAFSAPGRKGLGSWVVAFYRREIVRRYNGGTEIRFVGGTFVLVPNVSAAIFVPYPNTVLGTNVAYTGIGKQVPFPATEFGP